MFLTIALGLMGLGVVVLVHELGHFFAARLMGVEVEAFSIGWGPKLAGFVRGKTEWRISALPIGGYCRMKGEEAFRKALEEKSEELPREDGSFYGAAPWRRIVIALAGPAANMLFAALVFVAVAAIGYSVRTSDNRIVLASEFDLDGDGIAGSFPADAAGLRSGDRIVRAGGAAIADYTDIQEQVALSAGKTIELEVERTGSILRIQITPQLDRTSGAGRIGVYSWIDTHVETVESGSASAIAGFLPGDRLIALGGKPVRHAIELYALLAARPERVLVSLERSGMRLDLPMVLSWAEDGSSNMGLAFASRQKSYRAASLGSAIGMGLAETWDTFSLSLRSIGLLFKGVDLLKAISGPARITYIVGKSAAEGLAQESSGGIALPLNLLAFLSIGLFIMNLLPIPALDGGQIAIFLVETVRGKMMKPRTIYRFQFIGATFLFAIFIFATVGDVLFFAAK